MVLAIIKKHFTKKNYNKNSTTYLFHLLKVIIGGCISAIGLGTNSQPTIVGSMLISPLSEPLSSIIYYLRYGTQDINYFKEHLYYFIIDILLLIGIGYIFGIIFYHLYVIYSKNDEILKEYPSTEMKSRRGIVSIISNGMIAFLAGLLLFNSFISKDLTYLIGIGIATSFLPPLVNFGMILYEKDITKKMDSLYIFIISCVCLTLSSVIIPKRLSVLSRFVKPFMFKK
jgi:uncharacterized membrane protein